MENKLVHMRIVRDVLARHGWRVIDIGFITTRESSYGAYLQPDKDVFIMYEDHTVRIIPYAEVMRYVNEAIQNS